MDARVRQSARFSIPSIVALVAALLSFSTGAFWGFVLAIIAILCGAIGVVMSLSPSVRGGIMSIIGVSAGALALIAALVKTIRWIM